MNLVPYLVIFIGSGIGGAMRHGVNEIFSETFAVKFPLGILAVNVTGSILLGLLAGYFAFKGDAAQHWRLFLMVGLCGGYTTFSTFTQDAVLLIERGQIASSALYITLSVALSITGFIAALWAMRQLA
ncbi:MAG: fluoride efflux transporter CrcB [Micavibrio sp.]